MPTQRLGDHERNRINTRFNAALSRARNNKIFPLTEDETWEFGLSLLDPVVVDCYTTLRDKQPALTTIAGWNPDFNIRSYDNNFNVTLYDAGAKLPTCGLEVTAPHPQYEPIRQWCEYYWAISEDVLKAEHYVDSDPYSLLNSRPNQTHPAGRRPAQVSPQ